MSYILDALRKSDQQRQLGTTPTLQTAPPVATPSNQPGLAMNRWLLATAAFALIFAGALIGWLHPWRAAPEQETARPAPSAAPAPAAPSSQSQRPPSALPVPADPGVQPAGTSGGAAEPFPRHTGTQNPAVPTSRRSAAVPAPSAGADVNAGKDQQPLPPPDAQPDPAGQELPGLVIAFHLYSANPAKRRVMINNELLREGTPLANGLTVEKITPEGVVLEYRGQRFQRTIR